MSDTVIKFDHVTKVYKLYRSDKQRFLGLFSKKIPFKENRATNDVSFEIKRGEGVVLLGKNGAGKSTILKMITGVSYPSSGKITVNGRVSALLELTAGFDPEFTGRENIYLKCNILGLKDAEVREVEDAIIEFADIGDYIDQPVRMYSSGMRARLGFAINANIDPEILIVDEALSVGDKAFQKKCVQKVNAIMRDQNVTLLFVTHSVNMAKEFCQRGIVLEKGKIIFDGSVEDAIEIYNS